MITVEQKVPTYDYGEAAFLSKTDWILVVGSSPEEGVVRLKIGEVNTLVKASDLRAAIANALNNAC